MPDTETPPKPKIDPFMQRLAGSLLNAVVADDLTLSPLPKEIAERDVPDSGLNVAEQMAMLKKPEPPAAEKKPDDKPPETPPADPPKVEAKVETPPPEKAPETPPAPEVPIKTPVSDQVLEIQRKIQAEIEQLNRAAQAQVEATKKPPEKPPEPPKPSADEEYDRTLPDESQEVLDVLKWAESNPEHKGKAAEYRSYLRKLDEFAKANPEADETELEHFKSEHKPAIKPSTIRKLREERILQTAEERAIERVRKENSAELESLRKKQRDLEIKPLLTEAEQEFERRFLTPAQKIEGGLEPEIAKAILSKEPGAEEKYDLEAPILKRHLTLSKEFMEIASGVKDVDMGNPLHKNLLNFIAAHEQQKLNGSEAGRIRDGKQFVTFAQYDAFSKADPNAKDKYWTFSDHDIRGLLERNAHLTIANERKKVREQAEKMGYELKPKEAPKVEVPKQQTETPPKTPPTPPPENSPKGGSSRAPGAAKTDAVVSPNIDALKNLFPGIDKLV